MIEPGSWRRRTRWTRLTYGLLAVAAIVLLLLDRPAARPAFFDTLRAGSDDLAAPVMSGVSAPLSGIRSLRENLKEHWAVHDQNEALRARLEEMEGWRDLALSLRDTVSAYEAILEVPGVAFVDPVVAWTVAESGGPFQHARLMTVGKDKNVKPGYPVLTDRGLVGRVVSVAERSSRVLLLTDSTSRVPVMTEDGEVRSVLWGDNTNAPKLEFASGSRRMAEGDRIVTSGDAGVFPRGLPIGVAGVTGDELWRVALYSDSEPIDAVWVYPYEPIAPPPPEAVTPVAPPPAEPAADETAADDAAGDEESPGGADAADALPADAAAAEGEADGEAETPVQQAATAGEGQPE